MKLPLLLTSLLLSASPVVAQDVVVFECFVTVYGTLIDAETSNVVDSRKEESPIYFTVDFKNKMIATGDQPSEPFDMKEDQLVYESRKDDGVFNMTIQMNPPGELLATGEGTHLVDDKLHNVLSRMTGTCKRFN